MLRTILVPLDGSTFAEHALPLAANLAEWAQGTLRLVRVHGPSANYVLTGLDDEQVRRAETAYLDEKAGQLREAFGLAVNTALLDGLPAAALLDDAVRAKADLVALTTHGRGPISRFWLGSVTDELLRRSPV